ncbi:MAG TPA: hypothetical protein VKV06_06820 [Acidimicrobiales bacterium]|nr:hypothetical protein [Acidimicrobiales bacterium]
MTTYATRSPADAAEAAPRAPAHLAHRRPAVPFYLPAVVASLAAGTLSVLLGPRGLGYDPWSWLIWGRELVHGTFTTAGAATSFKPLPVVVTAVFGWTSAAPMIWLAVARAGAALAIILAFRVGWRLAGPAAGLIGAVGLLASSQYVTYLATAGMSEPIGAALTLVAVDAHLSRRRGLAVAMLWLAGLVRIEMWAFVALYGLWWLWRERGRRRLIVLGALAVLLVALPAAWFLPDYVTTGDLLRSAQDAAHQSQGGPLLAAVPALATFKEAAGLMPWPFTAAFCAELVIVGPVVLVRHRRVRVAWGLALAAFALVAIEAVMVQLDLDTAAPRYLLQSVAAGAVVAGCFAVDAVRWLAGLARRPQGARSGGSGRPLGGGVSVVATLAAVVVVLGASAPNLVRTGRQIPPGVRGTRPLAILVRQLPEAIAQAGGRAHVLACGPVATAALQVPTVTWALDLPLGRVADHPAASGTVFSLGHDRPPVPAAWYGRYTTVGHTAPSGPRWREQTTCPPARWYLAHPAQERHAKTG